MDQQQTAAVALTRPGPAGHYRATRVLPDNLGYLFDTALAISPARRYRPTPTWTRDPTAVAAASGAASVRVWPITCGGHEGATAAERA